MRVLRFGRTGRMVPAVGLGTWAHGGPVTIGSKAEGWTGHDDKLATAALLRGYELGLTHWDTADVYGGGRAERLIGALWDHVPRSEVFLATKVGWHPGPDGRYYYPGQVRAAVEGSLRRLRTERVELCYFHHCDFGPCDERLDEAVASMRRLQEEGKILWIGLSDWRCDRIMHYAPLIDADVVQPCRNVLDDTYESSGLKAWVESHDLGVAFFSPLKHGLLLGKHRFPTAFGAGDHRRDRAEFGSERLLAHFQACGAEVQLRFRRHPQALLHALVGALLSDAASACVLIGLRNPDQAAAAAAVGEPLAAADSEWVRRLYSPAPEHAPS